MERTGSFLVNRHLGPSETEVQEMLTTLGVDDLQQLVYEAVPDEIRDEDPLNIPAPVAENRFLDEFKKLASRNKVYKSFIGQGYYGTVLPSVIRRNVLENPGWYTAYTPYQAEIAQGRLEALLSFQTMVIDLTGMELANASLLDESTAVAEAMSMLLNVTKKKEASTFYVVGEIFPQNLSVLQGRAEPKNIRIIEGTIEEAVNDPDTFGILLQYPDGKGEVSALQDKVKAAHDAGAMVAVVADLLSLCLLESPGKAGADVVVGSAQRFGVPVGYGGPHPAYFATREKYKRKVPGRIIGVAEDEQGNTAYRMALQTREQHIKRERATSNICTSQVLLAVMAGFYAIYHGARGVKEIASEVHKKALRLNHFLKSAGFVQENKAFFDTLCLNVSEEQSRGIKAVAEEKMINFRYEAGRVLISVDEATTDEDIETIKEVFDNSARKANNDNPEPVITDDIARKTEFLGHPVFNSFHSETEMLRYIKRLENKDLSLVHSMIPLGSCTMKLNASSEMLPLTWEGWSEIHPYAPAEQAPGYQEMISTLAAWLQEITGFSGVSFQPNSGAQGEFAGLLVIREFFRSLGQERDVALIPSSAHGTNPASAVMAGFEVVVVNCDERGNISIDDLKSKLEDYKDRVGALIVTYPSTHGVFESTIKEICELVHEAGAQVYMDGANMNAQVGLTSPALIGADVCHLNLHKTFCIPHGGGGPGMGPVCVARHLVPFLPDAPVKDEPPKRVVAAAPYGSASILTISYAYIRMMGGEGLTQATRTAILNANYLMNRLKEGYPLLYAGKKGRCAHEFIIDCRSFKQTAGVDVEDIAKRLIDYGFHSPTVSFPVPGTMMIEPTESESKSELDRFAGALLSIRNEIKEIEEGKYPKERNLLKNAPHTQDMIVSSEWEEPYTREQAVFPLPWVRERKFWPAVRRINSAKGDRNLVCACPPVETYIG